MSELKLYDVWEREKEREQALVWSKLELCFIPRVTLLSWRCGQLALTSGMCIHSTPLTFLLTLDLHVVVGMLVCL